LFWNSSANLNIQIIAQEKDTFRVKKLMHDEKMQLIRMG
jgi:hypothetical protein